MSVVWTLEYDGEVRPLRQWGLENAVLEFTNQLTDTMKLVVAGEDPDEASQFEFEKRVVLFRDGVRWFTGWITQLPTSLSAGGDRQEYIASGPWWWLETIIYQQPHWVLVDPNAPQLGYAAPIDVSKAVLFQSSTGTHSNAGDMAEDVVDYAIFKVTAYNGGVPLFARGDFDDLVAEAPWEKALDLTCAEALRRCTRWSRDAVAWWDYSEEVPVLQIQRRAGLIAAEIDLAAGLLVASASATPRPDLVPRGVNLRFQQTITIEDEGSDYDGKQSIKYTTQTAGMADGGPRVVTATLPLSGTGEAEMSFF